MLVYYAAPYEKIAIIFFVVILCGEFGIFTHHIQPISDYVTQPERTMVETMREYGGFGYGFAQEMVHLVSVNPAYLIACVYEPEAVVVINLIYEHPLIEAS